MRLCRWCRGWTGRGLASQPLDIIIYQSFTLTCCGEISVSDGCYGLWQGNNYYVYRVWVVVMTLYGIYGVILVNTFLYGIFNVSFMNIQSYNYKQLLLIIRIDWMVASVWLHYHAMVHTIKNEALSCKTLGTLAY